MERTWPGPSPLLSPRWLITSGQRRRLPIAPIDTTTATVRSNRTSESDNSSIDSASSSTRDTVGELTPRPSPTTAFTTPATSPLRDESSKGHTKPQNPTNNPAHPSSGLEGITSDAEALKARIDVWVKRYFAEVIHTRQLQEELHKSGKKLAEA